MGFTVDIDTGGTFTDGLFTDGAQSKRVKVDTTPHDLTVAWINCLREGAKQFGFSTLRQFLELVDIMRWTSTVATNVIAEQKGPKLGLFVTETYEKNLYSEAAKSPVLGRLVNEANVEAVKFPLDPDKLLLQIKPLLEKGVRRICISLKKGLEHDDELTIKKIFEEQYPDHYLGNVPLLLGRDILKRRDAMTRTHVALMNSYVHGPMAMTMFKAEDELRERGFSKPLLVGHIDGGVARVSKTKPVDTIESGPIFGVHAGAYWAELYQLPHVITLDLGGTTAKIALVENFRPALTREPDILGIPLKQTMLDLNSIALGGGSVARANGKGLTLGPKSMGAYPGPACYDLGGGEATLTDAYVVKGFIDPEYFSAGTKKINRDRAEKLIQEKVAAPLGVDVHLASYQIAGLATDMIAETVKKVINRTGVPAGDYVLLAFGGNGGVVGCEVAKKVGVKQVYFFDEGSVMSAFGSSVADVSHSYEYYASLPANDAKSLSEIINWMAVEATRDMEGEGFNSAIVESELHLALYNKDREDDLFQVTLPWNLALDPNSVSIVDELQKSGIQNAQDLIVEILRLRVSAPLSKLQSVALPTQSQDPGAALKGEREISRGSERVLCKVYQWDKLCPGNTIRGPSVIEGTDTTYIVPRGWDYSMDTFGNGFLIRR
ncbi:MAG: hydantoinase/oxoprolinase family protein [Pseudomonadota bacterium]